MTSNWVVCLKHGKKYSHEYVNILYNMVKRNCSIPFNFACITENPAGINSNIKIIPLPKNLKIEGWWYKPWVFSKDFPLTGTILFLDLDIVLIKNIDNLWNYEPDKFCIIRDFARLKYKDWPRFNSSVFRFNTGKYQFVWDNLIKDLSQTKKMHGDQDWIYSQIKDDFVYWPEQWICSYKWEIRSREDLTVINKKYIFKNVINPIIKDQTNILVFHGDPKPNIVNDPIIVKNWR